MHSLRRTLLLTAAILLTPSLVLAQETEVLAVSPIAAPDGNGTIANFIHPIGYPDKVVPNFGAVLNDNGQVVVTAYLTDTEGDQDVDDSALLLIDENGSLTPLARAGDPSPDGEGQFYYIAPPRMPALNNDGNTAFSAILIGNDGDDAFEWGQFIFDETGQQRLLIREGDPSPDGEGVLDFIATPSLNQSGQAFFIGEIEPAGSGTGRALFKADLSTEEVTLLVREYDPLPDASEADFRLLSGSGLNESGQLVFQSSIESSQFDDYGYFIMEPDGTTVTELVRRGDAAPGGDVFNQFRISRPPINELGQVALASDIASCADCAATGASIFMCDGETTQTVARTGQPAPNGGVWFDFGEPCGCPLPPVSPALNDRSQVAFFGHVYRDDLFFRGIYRVGPEGSVEIANNGQYTPSGNGLFQLSCASGNFDCNDAPFINDEGQVAFFTNIRDAQGGVLENEGIFFYDDALGLLEVVRENDMLLGSPIRKLRFTDVTGTAKDNTNSGLNNLGQVAYTFMLEDGRSGVALWTPPEIIVETEPTAGVPREFAVESAYPNPFRDTATLRVALPTTNVLTVAVYDVLGRRVLERDLGRLAAGTHPVSFSGEAFAPGLYVARLITGTGDATSIRLTKTD